MGAVEVSFMGFWIRAVAFVIDFFLFVLPFAILATAMPESAEAVISMSAVLAFILYMALMT